MQGIVYKTIDYKDTDRICYLLTDKGPISVRVRRARLYKSKHHAFSNLLTLNEFEVYKAPILGLRDFNIIDNLYNIKTNYDKLNISINILETASLEHNINQERLFNFIKAILLYINDNDDYLKAYFIYLVKMLKIFGILPNIDSNNCLFSHISLNNNELELIRSVYYGDINNSITINVGLVVKIITYYESMGLAYFYKIKEFLKEKSCE